MPEQTPPEPTTEPLLLRAGLVTMFYRATFAEGELEMPCLVERRDDYLGLVLGVLRALKQNPPDKEIEHWRQILGAKLSEGTARGASARLVVRYEPFDALIGLTGGLLLKIALRDGSDSGGNGATPGPDTTGELLPIECLVTARGQLRMPCVPSLLDEQIRLLGGLLRSLGQTNLGDSELDGWRGMFAEKLPGWFAMSANSYLVFEHEPLDEALGLTGGITLDITHAFGSVESNYRRWTQTREGPLFGTHPDAKVVDTAARLGYPAAVPVLDVGAGTGRNCLALARLGHPVDALELTEVLTERLWQAAQAEQLPVRVIRGDAFDPELSLPTARYGLIFLSEVIASHLRSPEQVGQLLARLCTALRPGGLLLFNTFLAVDGYEPDAAAREMSQVYWSYLMTRTELHEVLIGLPLTLLSDESACSYEREHLPPEAWPPTSWFVNWATGRNLFPITGTPPLELRWLLCRQESPENFLPGNSSLFKRYRTT